MTSSNPRPAVTPGVTPNKGNLLVNISGSNPRPAVTPGVTLSEQGQRL